MTIEKLHFKTSSGIKSIVGKDLITDKFVAIFELVKNSYDAGAKEVKITFDQDKITILDDGHGMSKNDLVQKWLNLAYSDKKEGRENKDRAFVGSKGIGRFSADRLGKKLKVTTKIASEEIYHQLDVYWDKFDEDLKKLFENIELDYRSNTSEKSKHSSYTKIEITDLNENWEIAEINKAKESLRRLKNPFVKNDGFKLLVIDKTVLLETEEYIESNISEVLKDKSITIQASFLDEIQVVLYDRGEKIYEAKAKNNSILKSCPIHISINYLTTSAKTTFTRRMKIEPVNYGNIFIYKNDFRVMPYGEVDFDTFGLNMRKTQGYSRYLGHREILGYIDIKDIKNHYFREASSRDSGFVDNAYVDELKEMYIKYIHRPLETFVQLVSWGEVKDSEDGTSEEVHFEDIGITEVDKFRKYISRNVEILYFKSGLNFDDNKPEKKLEKIIEKISLEEKKIVEPLVKEVKKQVNDLKKVSKEQERTVVEQNKTIEVLERQAKNLSVKRTEASYTEQLNHHLTLFSKRLNSVIIRLADLEEKIYDPEHKKELKDRSRTIKRTADEMVAFRDILSKSDMDAKSPQTINWIELLEWRIKNTDFPINCYVIKDIDDFSSWTIKVNVLEFVIMVDNFINNAEEHNANFIEFDFKSKSLCIKSDSKLIDDKLLDKVFELGISTKRNGTGIGLNQIEKSLKKLDMSITARNENNLVCFEIVRN